MLMNSIFPIIKDLYKLKNSFIISYDINIYIHNSYRRVLNNINYFLVNIYSLSFNNIISIILIFFIF